MPATERAVRLTNAYRARLLAIRQRATSGVAGGWRLVELRDLERSFERWQRVAAAQLEQSQRDGVALAAAYFAAYLAAELGKSVPTPSVDPAKFAGRDSSGRSLDVAFAPALITVKMALAQGRQQREALRMGRNRATGVAASESIAAPRAAQAELMRRDDRIDGWRRVTAPGACLACLASATGVVEHRPMRQHRFCRCQMEPLVNGTRDTITRPTGREIFDALSSQEQDRQFGEKAALIRDGTPFENLVTQSPMKTSEDWITETPLAALK